MTPSFQEIVLILFVGMGPVKVIVYYLASIHDATPAVGRRVAIRAVGTATLTALGLLVIGALLFRLLHFSAARARGRQRHRPARLRDRGHPAIRAGHPASIRRPTSPSSCA